MLVQNKHEISHQQATWKKNGLGIENDGTNIGQLLYKLEDTSLKFFSTSWQGKLGIAMPPSPAPRCKISQTYEKHLLDLKYFIALN